MNEYIFVGEFENKASGIRHTGTYSVYANNKDEAYDKFLNEMYTKYANGDTDFITISSKSETEFYLNLPTDCVPVELSSTTFANQINFSSAEQFPKSYWYI